MRFSRWLVPAAVAATVAGGTVVQSAAAGGVPDVPSRTAAEVLALAGTSKVEALSGTVRTTADLGLPNLQSLAGAGGGEGGTSADPQAVLTRLLTGETTLRVWLDGPQRQRVQLLDRFSEVSLVHDGQDVWAYDTGRAEGTHWVLPSRAAVEAYAKQRAAAHGPSDGTSSGPDAKDPKDPRTALAAATPQGIADEIVSRLDPTTSVTLDTPTTVAGRPAYTLVVRPRTDGTLVDHAVLVVDAGTGLALRAQVYARGHAEPVLETGFTDLDLSRPAADRFAFTPPAGADVETQQVPLPPAGAAAGTGSRSPDKASGADRPDVKVVGSGWTAVLVTAAPKDGSSAGSGLAGDPQAQSMLDQLTTPVEGGRALRTALFSVLLTDDGRVLAGAVPVETLVAAAR